MQLVTDSSMDSDETSCDDDSSWVYESESSDGSTRLNRHYLLYYFVHCLNIHLFPHTVLYPLLMLKRFYFLVDLVRVKNEHIHQKHIQN